MPPVRRDVFLEESARAALDSAEERWRGCDVAWMAIEWALVHDPQIGVPLNEAGTVRAFVYDGAVSIDQPDVRVTYEIHAEHLVIRRLVFSPPKASQAGRA